VLGAEVSGVAFAAVSKTSVDDVRASLSEYRHDQGPTKDDSMTPTQLKAIGLPADASEEQIAQKLGELKQQADAASALEVQKLAAEEERDVARGKLAAQATAEAARASQELDALRESALADGRIVVDDRRDKLFQGLRESDPERAKEFLAALDSGSAAPVGVPLQSRQQHREPVTPGRSSTIQIAAEKDGVSPAAAELVPKALAALGLTDEDYAKYGDHAVHAKEVR